MRKRILQGSEVLEMFGYWLRRESGVDRLFGKNGLNE